MKIVRESIELSKYQGDCDSFKGGGLCCLSGACCNSGGCCQSC